MKTSESESIFVSLTRNRWYGREYSKLLKMLRLYSTHREGREMSVHVHWVPLVKRICTIAAPGPASFGGVCDSNYRLCNGSRDTRKFGSARSAWRRIIDDKKLPTHRTPR